MTQTTGTTSQIVLSYYSRMLRSSRHIYQQLTSADVARLKDLLRVFGEAFEDVDTYQRAVPSDEYLPRLLSKQHFIAVAAMKGSEVVGGLAAYVLDKFEQDRREIYIYDLAVLEGHRRQGIATGVINKLRSIAADRDVYVIFVVPSDRRIAHKVVLP